MDETPTIYCPNHLCQAANPESHKFCRQCRTPLPKNYLWLSGKGVQSLRVGELLAERYLVKQDRIVLDTQPGILPQSPEDIPAECEPYLQLTPFQLYIPQVYGIVQRSHPSNEGTILLLEHVPLDLEENNQAGTIQVRLLPELTALWQQSTELCQLNWLWQIAQLWQPFTQKEVATTLLKPELIRVEGSLVRLLELHSDHNTPPSLRDLGQLWQQWQATARSHIAAFLGQLCQQMVDGQIRTAEQLGMILDRAIDACAPTQIRHVQLATRTDQGPTRQRNEDACYPPSGSVVNINPIGSSRVSRNTSFRSIPSPPLIIVCDGIGGHEGGDVASNLAIATIQQYLEALPQPINQIDPILLTTELEQATLAANDVLNQRNDSEQRQERQRMGTTLVMGLLHDHELYITHVGDSRAYRITASGCHQVTLDDDLAAREVRLGYTLYRNALQQPSSGSLVQALGMSASSMLYPTVQRFILDEDCLFLLCSDGLSDNDLVEQYWQAELSPLLQRKIDIVTANQRLITLANRQNGHDNVTVGLIYCQVEPDYPTGEIDPLPASLASLPLQDTPATTTHSPDSATTQILTSRPSPFASLLPLLVAVVLAGLGGCLAYLLIPEVHSRINALLGLEFSPLPSPVILPASPPPPSSPPSPSSPPPPSSPPLPSSPAPLNLSVGTLIQVTPTIPNTPPLPPLVLLSQPGTYRRAGSVGGLPPGTVLQITNRQTLPNQSVWLKLKVCSLPSRRETPAPTARTTGWIAETAIAPRVTQDLRLTASQVGQCATGL
jgi:serine/threonine protein phosphatase PrpC